MNREGSVRGNLRPLPEQAAVRGVPPVGAAPVGVRANVKSKAESRASERQGLSLPAAAKRGNRRPGRPVAQGSRRVR